MHQRLLNGAPRYTASAMGPSVDGGKILVGGNEYGSESPQPPQRCAAFRRAVRCYRSAAISTRMPWTAEEGGEALALNTVGTLGSSLSPPTMPSADRHLFHYTSSRGSRPVSLAPPTLPVASRRCRTLQQCFRPCSSSVAVFISLPLACCGEQ